MIAAHQGAPGSFSSAAARRMYPEADLLSVPSFGDVFEAVAAGKADTGVVPIENSIAGSVHENLDLLSRYELVALRQLLLPVSHALMARPGQVLDQITQVRSHPQALAQCAGFLKAHDMEPIAWTNTADAARDLDVLEVGVLASIDAAELYDLEIMVRDCQGRSDNATSFLAVGRELADSGTRALIEFTCVNGPGRLLQCLQVIADQGFNMSRLESRPLVDTPWQYRFFTEIEEARSGLSDQQMLGLVRALETAAVSSRLLGLY